MRPFCTALVALAAVLGSSCGRSKSSEPPPEAVAVAAVPTLRHVFVVAMENTDASTIYGNTVDAPYINGVLFSQYARATNFRDELPLPIPSEPHYIWTEAGTNAFADHTFTDDEPPSATNSTSDTTHLVSQIAHTNGRVTWRSYQEGMNAATGACPIHDDGLYAPKHDPFVFFKDVAGDPPSADNAYCAAHHRPYAALAADLAGGDVASYTFITPDLCHDMHGAPGCYDAGLVRRGDDWLRSELPRLIAYVVANAGVIFVEWDEGAATASMPFLAIGPSVKSGYAGTAAYDHGSLLKSVEAIFGLPTIGRVARANELSDLFRTGGYP